MKQVSAGFIIDTPLGWLLCHPTGSFQDRWDFPKGRIENGEDFMSGAIRELQEETGLVYENLKPYILEQIDLGESAYQSDKRIHMIYIKVSCYVNPASLECSTDFECHGRMIPEMDAYRIVPREEVSALLGKNMKKYLVSTLPMSLSIDPAISEFNTALADLSHVDSEVVVKFLQTIKNNKVTVNGVEIQLTD